MIERKAHREICGLCHEVSRVGFFVPPDDWRAALHESQWNEIVCLACFTRLADERGVEWDQQILFHPVSRMRHERNDVAPLERLHDPAPRGAPALTQPLPEIVARVTCMKCGESLDTLHDLWGHPHGPSYWHQEAPPGG